MSATMTEPATTPAADELSRDLERSIRAARFAFLDAIEPHRPALYRFCRSLTSSPWDADDLVQESLARAFDRISQHNAAITSPRSWLLRTATNVWIDRQRRAPKGPALDDEAVAGAAAPDDAPALSQDEVRDALRTLARRLPPRERAIVVLVDVFGLTTDEASTWLETTRGAAQAALHRGRTKLRERAPQGAAASRADAAAGPSEELLDRFVVAFNARDMKGLSALLLEGATAEVTSMVAEQGREQIVRGSLHHTLFDEAGEPRAERVVLDGETVVILRYTKEGVVALEDVLRFETRDGGIAALRYAYFCPEVLAEVGAALGEPVRDNGYRYRPPAS